MAEPVVRHALERSSSVSSSRTDFDELEECSCRNRMPNALEADPGDRWDDHDVDEPVPPLSRLGAGLDVPGTEMISAETVRV